MLSPDFQVGQIAARRRYKGKPWLKQGTLLRLALDALRAGTGPMTSKEVALAMLATKDAAATPEEVLGLAAVQTALRKQGGQADSQ